MSVVIPVEQRSDVFRLLEAKYPRVVENFRTFSEGAEQLWRLYDLNGAWQSLTGDTRSYDTVVLTEPKTLPPGAPTFDVIYAGGGLNTLNAAVLSGKYGYQVMVMDRFKVGAVHREWNISREELNELVRLGLLTADEVKTVVQRTYREGTVDFYPANISVPHAELRVKDVLDVAVDAEKLTNLCMRKVGAARPDNRIVHQMTFRRCYVQPGNGGVVVEAQNQHGESEFFGARLMVDGMGATSPVACQFNCGRPFSLICPTVGTVARGYKAGTGPGEVDLDLGEILVTTTDATAGKQYIWEVFPGIDNQVVIYLFYYNLLGGGIKNDLLDLFEEFFRILPGYKAAGPNFELVKPVYGLIPAGYNPASKQRKVLAFDRVLSLGDAAAMQSPLTFCGFGSYVRNLRRITTLLDYALRHDSLTTRQLKQVRAYEAAPALARSFSKFMIASPGTKTPPKPAQVNEIMNVFCRALEEMGPSVTQDFFKDRIGWADYSKLILRVPTMYPDIFKLTLDTLTPGEIRSWITSYIRFSGTALKANLYKETVRKVKDRPLVQRFAKWVEQKAPQLGFRVLAEQTAIEQYLRKR